MSRRLMAIRELGYDVLQDKGSGFFYPSNSHTKARVLESDADALS